MKRILFALLLAGCTTAPVAPTPTEPSAPTVPAPSGPSSADHNLSMMTISRIASSNGCSKHEFGNRGAPNKGFLKGLIISYARTLCLYRSPVKTYAGSIALPYSTAVNVRGFNKDALYHYSVKNDSGPKYIEQSDKPEQRIKQTYVVMIGLAARESSFQYGVGWDRSKLPDIQPSANNSETGMFQVSYDNNKAMPDSAAIYEDYKKHPDRCSLDIFKEGGGAVAQDFVGKPSIGYDFQYFMRYCPALQLDYAAAGIRVNTPQWGPLKRKEAEYYKPCEDMLSQVESELVCK